MPASPGFADRLKAAIERDQTTKSQLAQDSGVGRTTIDEWLAGRLPVKPGPVRALAKALGVPFRDLWGEAQALEVHERTRLVQLESLARRMIGLAREAELVVGEIAEASTMQPERVDQEGEEKRSRRKRGA